MEKNFFFLIVLVQMFSIITFSQSQEPIKMKMSPVLQEMIKLSEAEDSKAIESLPVKPLGKNQNNENIYGVIIKTDKPTELKSKNINVNSIIENFVTARVTIKEILVAAALNSVDYIEIGEILYPTNDMAGAVSGADMLHSGYVNGTAYKGSGVIVCIVDSGLDWSHEDFRNPADPSQSRVLYIWDQTLTKTGAEVTPQDRDGVNLAGLNYGVEYSNADIENELDGSPAGFVREEDTNGHGTHVCGTAAGNGASLTTKKYAGIAPEADLLIVKSGNASFPTNYTIDALTYAKKIGEQLGKPVVVNMSLGGHSNPHDGTNSFDAAVNSFTGAGRIAVISAGNDGTKNIHITGTVANSATVNFTFTVPSYTPNGGTDNDYFGFDLWFDTDGSVSATVTSPNSQTATQNAQTSGTTETATDGSIYIYNYINGSNNDRQVYTYIDDNVEAKPPAAGTWTISVTNNSGSTMTYHGWLFGSSMGATLTGGNSQYTVASPGTATNAITVGSYASRWYWYSSDGNSYWGGSPDYSDDISPFSSIGPRRDGVQKPDIAAPGQHIISSTSSDYTPIASDRVPGNKHHKNQGTSMSSPVAAGAVALLLQQNPSLTYAQAKTYLTDNAVTDSYTGALPDYYWGYGKLNIFKAMIEMINSGWPTQCEIFSYDQWTSTSGVGAGAFVQMAVRFSPTFNGKVTGLLFHTYTAPNITGPVYAEIWSNNAGLPNAKLGSTVTFSQDNLLGHSWNYINMESAGVDVTSGTDYHAVIYFLSGTVLGIMTDNGSVDNRSSLNTGTWGAYGQDFRMRPVVSVSNSLLPVELVSFAASTDKNTVVLNWITATEINNYGFEIERGEAPGGSENPYWQKIGFVAGHGNSNKPTEYNFIDNDIISGRMLYRLKQIDIDGSINYSGFIEVNTEAITPAEYSLEQNYPNPFNPVTKIRYSVPKNGDVLIVLYDILGRKITTIVGEFKLAGNYEVEFGNSDWARELPSGIYFYQMISGKFSETKKMMLLK